MMRPLLRRIAGPLLAASLAACASAPAPAPALRLIGVQQLPADFRIGGVQVGGISGMDYDAAAGEWLLATDDRGEHGPSGFYRARIAFDAERVGAVEVAGAQAWRQPDGGSYAARGRPGLVADVESLRIDPRDGSLWYGSEGDREAAMPSFIRRSGRDGRFLGELPYPPALQIRPGCACGGRSNLGPEGLSFTPDGARLWMAMEAPPLQDGPVASPGHGVATRISLMERDGRVVAQYAYPLDPAPAPAKPGGFSDNGISEILAIDGHRLLVLERAGKQVAGGAFVFDVRLYEAEVAAATPVDPESPLPAAVEHPMAKRLLFDSARLPPGWSDNYEAMAWGPRLANGHRSLLLASDNNFSGAPTRFLVFDAGP